MAGQDDGVGAWITDFSEGLRAAMFLTGSPDLAALRRHRPVVMGTTAEWLRGSDVAKENDMGEAR
jgi:isopentenyl diphosphate isomerase/L-lactate dehydrogenase-like FMN-dependent dehydrogenase